MSPAAALRTTLGSLGHDQELSIVGHLDELRTRMIVALTVVAVAFGFCFWQNHALLRLVNAPLAHQTQQQVRKGRGTLGATYTVQKNARDVAVQLRTVVGVLETQHLAPTSTARLAHAGSSLSHDIKRLSAAPSGDQPVTLGIGEPFTTTITVTLIFALILSLPVLLLQAYGFFMPALEPVQRRRVRSMIFGVPVLFVSGVVFGYVIVLPDAIHFLQNFNSDQFNVLVQASQYYKFAAEILLAMGLLFQIPIAILFSVRSGLVTARQLRAHRRWALAICAAIGALLPGDAFTMLLEAIPLYLLFEASVLIAGVMEIRDRRGQTHEPRVTSD